MHSDSDNTFRAILEDDPPKFLDRVNTPWDQVPDLPQYNQSAYNRIVRALRELSRSRPDEGESNTQGILVLGEAGTGKTHLLMRVARELSHSNHILFVRKPNNEEAVAQHVWANVVSSLARSLPASGKQASQLDDLLAHVFSKVLIPELEQDISEGKDADQKQRWVSRLQADPNNLFSMLGEGEQRQSNMEKIRRRTLRYLQLNHPDVDQTIAHVLITYCFVLREERKRLLLNWLSGQDVDDADAKDLGLPSSWVTIDESSTETSAQQQREEQALRAIRTIGILSTYYQPLILAFDQLEGLRDQTRLTQRWGDTVREIFTMTPNFLIVTCIFPSLWSTWFGQTLDTSTAERIAQQVVPLETFSPQHALKMLATHLDDSFTRHRLPTSIYPFTEDDITALCAGAKSPRAFLQSARTVFNAWLDGDATAIAVAKSDGPPAVISQDEIDALLRSTLRDSEEEQRRSYDSELVVEQEFFGRVKNVFETLLNHSDGPAEYSKARCDHYVMPPNIVINNLRVNNATCLAVVNSEGNSFAARIRNLNKAFKSGGQFDSLVILRDRRCKRPGARSQQYLDDIQQKGAAYVLGGAEEIACLNSIYDTIVTIEEHDLCIGSHEIDKRQFVSFLKAERVCGRAELFRHAARLSSLIADATGIQSAPQSGFRIPQPPPPKRPANGSGTPTISPSPGPMPGATSVPRTTPPIKPAASPGLAQVVIGDVELDSPHLGVLGDLKYDRRRLAISLTKPQCLVLLGYMGSGKSYALGVLMENALLDQPGLIQQARAMSVVAFNYRRNPQARFEYGGFTRPNSQADQAADLAKKYGAEPAAVERVNVFGYEPELQRRQHEYEGLLSRPIQFRPDELGAEHWEILMKPPSKEAEYMDIIRDIIQKLFYQERLTFKNLEQRIVTDERLSTSQRRRALNRMSFAERWINDERPYEWSDVLEAGVLNIFDLRMQAMDASEALKLCLIITDLVRRTKNGVNKMIVFDEAHEYVDCKELVGELENSITQIRHDGLSFVLASQFPDRIPERIFKYLLTRMVFKLPNAKAINYIRNAAPNLESLSPQQVANLDLEQGVCFIQTDDDCSDQVLRIPHLLEVRPRCTMHGGATLRNTVDETDEESGGGVDSDVVEESEAELCPMCGGQLVLRRGPVGPFIGCSGYPACRYSQSL